MTDNSNAPIDRRRFLQVAGLAATAIGSGSILSACGGLKGSTASSSNVLRIGLVSPQTGPLASFATADNFVVQQIREVVSTGLKIGGKKREIEIIVKDTQSNPTRATEVTKQLITRDKVDVVIASGTPDTTNPVADQCEAAGIPNITTIAPWEAWFNGRGGKTGVGFKYSTMFFFGMAQFSECWMSMWDQVGTSSRNVAALWPDNSDANAFRRGLVPLIEKAGYTAIDGGKYQDGSSDFNSQIAKFKDAEAELFTCAPIPSDFQTYWKQAAQQGFRPKLATVGKVMLFPAEAQALGQLSNNIATNIWWSPSHPYVSSLDGTTATQLADRFAAKTGKQWTQALGSVYSLFEVAIKALQAANDPKDRDEVANNLHTLHYAGMSGELNFADGPEPGVAIQHPVGGQWRPGKNFDWDIVIVDNKPNQAVPLGGGLKPTFA